MRAEGRNVDDVASYLAIAIITENTGREALAIEFQAPALLAVASLAAAAAFPFPRLLRAVRGRRSVVRRLHRCVIVRIVLGAYLTCIDAIIIQRRQRNRRTSLQIHVHAVAKHKIPL